MALDNMTYEFEITLPAGRKTFKSEKYKSYERFVRDCEKKCRELGARSGDVTIFSALMKILVRHLPEALSMVNLQFVERRTSNMTFCEKLEYVTIGCIGGVLGTMIGTWLSH